MVLPLNFWYYRTAFFDFGRGMFVLPLVLYQVLPFSLSELLNRERNVLVMTRDVPLEI